MSEKSLHHLTPKLFLALREYTLAKFGADLVAGVTVGLVALPLAMAFSISSGVDPQAGIYTAVVAGFIAAVLGGSRCQVTGPTGAFVVIIAGIVATHGVSGLLMCTLMAGVMLMVMGMTGLGGAVRYIPRPVTIGFTNGIAVLIASTQIKDFFGLSMERVPSEFLERMSAVFESIVTVNWSSVAVGAAALTIILVWPRFTKRVPGSIVALLLTTAICAVFHVDVETIGSRFGGIPTGLPELRVPEFRPELIIQLLPSALTVTLLAAIESLLSAVVADNMSGDKHNPDSELFGQGVANLVVPFVGGIPATGAIARTATNIRAGAQSPIASIVHALTLLTVLLVAAPLARFIPLATLAAVLFVVAYNMGEWREIGTILRLPRIDRIVWLATFGLTVFADLTLAVEIGIVLAALLYIYQVSETTSVVPVTDEYIRDGKPHILQDKQIPPYVTILRIHGPFLFGATNKLDDATHDLSHFGPIVVLRLRNMTALDATGLHAIESFCKRLRTTGRSLVVCGARRQPLRLIRRSELMHLIGNDNLQPHIEGALHRAREIHEGFDGMGGSIAEDMAKQPT